MTISVAEFWKTLESLGLCDNQTAKDLKSAISAGATGAATDESVDIAKYLIKNGHLTRYQAKRLLSSRGSELRRGVYLILTDETESPFENYLVARDTETGHVGMLASIPSENLIPIFGDSVKLGRSSEIKSLQYFRTRVNSGRCDFFVSLPEGKPLTQVLSEKDRFSLNQIFRLGSSLLQALSSLESIGLAPDSLATDLIWVTKAGDAVVLINPEKSKSSSLFKISKESVCYIAPDSKHDEHPSAARYLIFSVGCILFRIATGRNPFTSQDGVEFAQVAETSTGVPVEIIEAVKAKNMGSPLYRVLAHAIAPNPSSRFQSFDDFINAWEAASATGSQTGSRSLNRSPKASQDPIPSTNPPNKSSVPSRNSRRRVVKNQTETHGSKKSTDRTNPLTEVVSAEDHYSATEAVASEPTIPSENLKSDANTGSKADKRPNKEVKKSETGRDGKSDAPNKVSGPSSQKSQASNLADETPTFDSPQLNQGVDAFQLSNGKGELESNRNHPQTPDDSEEPQYLNLMSDSKSQIDLSGESPGESLAIGDGNLEGTSPRKDLAMNRAALRRKKKKSNAPLILGGMCVAVLMLLIGLLVSGSGDSSVEAEPQARRKLPDVVPPVGGNKPIKDDQDVTEDKASLVGYEVVEDDRLLFVPPYGTDSETVPLSLLPPGPTVILSCRLQSVVKNPLGVSILKGVATGLEELIDTAIRRAQVPVEDIERLTVAMFPGEDGWPEVALAVELVDEVPVAEFIDRLSVEQARTRENQVIYVGEQDDADAFFWNADEETESIAAFAIGSIPLITEVANFEGAEIPLPRTSQSLWSTTSIESDLVVLFAPNFLFADGRELLATSAPELVKPLKDFLQPDVNTGLITVRFNSDQTVFFETRFAPSGGISEAALMKKISESANALPDWANQFILDSVQDSSWKLLAIRMPQMMQYLVNNMRFGLSENAVVANTYLPDAAFPQLVFAGLLAMNTSTSQGSSTVSIPDELLSVEQMLNREMTVSFDQESLEFALEAISTAFQDDLPAGNQMPKAVIIGGDLELMGITQNQQVRDFSKSQEPLRSVLTDLVLQANPDKTATGPQDLKQSLIWVVVDSDGKKEIRITTRQAADRDKYTIPKEFQPTES